MAYTITLSDKEAADIMGALGRMPVDQVAETYVIVKNQLTAAGYVAPMMRVPPPPAPPPPMAAPPHPAAAPAPKKG